MRKLLLFICLILTSVTLVQAQKTFKYLYAVDPVRILAYNPVVVLDINKNLFELTTGKDEGLLFKIVSYNKVGPKEIIIKCIDSDGIHTTITVREDITTIDLLGVLLILTDTHPKHIQ